MLVEKYTSLTSLCGQFVAKLHIFLYTGIQLTHLHNYI